MLLQNLPQLLALQSGADPGIFSMICKLLPGPLAFLVLKFHVLSSFEEPLHFGRIALEGCSLQSGAT